MCSLYSIWVDPRRLGTHIFHHFPRQFQLLLSFLLLLPKKPWFLPVASKLPRRHCVRSIYLSTARHAKRKLHASHSLAFLKGTNFHHNASVSLFVEYFHLLLARITSTKTKLQFAFILLTHKRFCQCSEDVSKNRHLLTSKKIGLRTVWIETFRLQGSKSKK